MYSGVSGDWVFVIQLQQPLEYPIKNILFGILCLMRKFATYLHYLSNMICNFLIYSDSGKYYRHLLLWIGHSPKKWLVVKLVNKVLGHSEIFLFVLKGVISLFVWKQKKKDKNTIWIGSSLENWPWQFWHHLFFLHFFLINVDLP